jgi:hypothetical protein
MGRTTRRRKAPRHLDTELRRLAFIPLIVVDEVGYTPFDSEAVNLMFSLVSARYERASLIVTSNKPFSAWGEIFGDDVVAATMIDRLVRHAEILSLKGDSYRLRDKDLGRSPLTPNAARADYTLRSPGPHISKGSLFQPAKDEDFSTGLDTAFSGDLNGYAVAIRTSAPQATDNQLLQKVTSGQGQIGTAATRIGATECATPE